ncbi:TPA: DUF1642 domain-containing protein [Streptococcus suis]
MNKQEAIELIQKMAEVISQIHQPQTVVVPKVVAEWIEAVKSVDWSLKYALTNTSDEVHVWIVDKDNQETFARAWIFGYEVEQERLYTVEIPNHNDINFKHTILAKNSEGEVFLTKVDSEDWKHNHHYQLTESEIKEDFEWAWQWAEPVEVE